MTRRKNIELASQLRKEILSGMYGTEGGLPGANELAKRSGFARNTVNSALSLLEGEKLIVKRDAAFYVNSIPLMMTRYAPQTHIRHGKGYTTNLDAVSEQPLPDHLASRLGVDQCAAYRVQVSGKIVDGIQQPLQFSRRYYFLATTEDELQSMKNDATFDPMWLNFAEKLVSRDEVCARFGTQEELTHLDLPAESPVLSVWELIKSKQGTLLMVQETTLVPRYALIFEFEFDNVPQ